MESNALYRFNRGFNVQYIIHTINYTFYCSLLGWVYLLHSFVNVLII